MLWAQPALLNFTLIIVVFKAVCHDKPWWWMMKLPQIGKTYIKKHWRDIQDNNLGLIWSPNVFDNDFESRLVTGTACNVTEWDSGGKSWPMGTFIVPLKKIAMSFKYVERHHPFRNIKAKCNCFCSWNVNEAIFFSLWATKLFANQKISEFLICQIVTIITWHWTATTQPHFSS